jgi:hypothetical protein
LLLLLLLLWQQAQVAAVGLINQQRHTLSMTQRGKLCSGRCRAAGSMGTFLKMWLIAVRVTPFTSSNAQWPGCCLA